MSRLTWSAMGERFYETGVANGVLYLANQDGVAWTGLISVDEAPTGGEAKPYYIDGVKFLNISTAEEFEATINAFFSPPEFAGCDGVSSIQNGLFATQQPRTAFGLSYQTKLGNDIDGADHAYKIHLVYNALAAPSSRTNNTISDSPEPSIFTWPITTLPPSLTGFKPTAHLVIDSRTTAAPLLASIEDILYGSALTTARLPMPNELAALFVDYIAPSTSFVRFTTTDATFSPTVELTPGSTAVVSWSIEGGATITGVSPTLNYGVAATNYVQMRVDDLGVSALDQVVTLNLGFNNADDAGQYQMGVGYNKAAQSVTTVENLPLLTSLIRFAAARVPFTSALDFTGMSALEFIECAYADVEGVNLTGCTALIRLCLEQTNLLVPLDLNPVAGNLRDLRSAAQVSGSLELTPLTSPLAQLYHFCVRDEFVTNHPTGTQLPVIEELWNWNSGQSGNLSIASTALTSLASSGNNYSTIASVGGGVSTLAYDLSGSAFLQADVDVILAAANAWGNSGGSLNLTGSAAPSSDTDVLALRSRGWTVVVLAAGTAPIVGVLSDDFERADVVGAVAVGNGWYGALGADANIVSGNLVRTDTGDYRVFVNPATVDQPTDYTVTAIIPGSTVATNFYGLVGRWDGTNGVRAMFTNGGGINVEIGDASGYSAANVYAGTPALPVGWMDSGVDHTLAMRMTGTQIELICDGTVIVTAAVPTNAALTGTGYGICGEGNGRSWRSIGTSVPAPVAPEMFSDDFERADAVDTAAVNNGWYVPVSSSSVMSIVGGDLVLGSGGGGYHVWANPANGDLPADYAVVASIPASTVDVAVGPATFFGLVGRWSGGVGVRALFYSPTSLHVGSAEVYNGVPDTTPVFTPPASWSNTTIDHTVALQMIGDQISIWCDGVVSATWTSTINQTVIGTEIGICGEGNNRRWHSIEATPTPLFDPYALPNLQLALDAGRVWGDLNSVTGIADGTAIDTWVDLSGTNHDVTQFTVANQPIFRNTGVNTNNGQPTVQFDGIDDVLSSVFTTDIPMSIYIVHGMVSAGSDNTNDIVLGLQTATSFVSVERQVAPYNFEIYAGNWGHTDSVITATESVVFSGLFAANGVDSSAGVNGDYAMTMESAGVGTGTNTGVVDVSLGGLGNNTRHTTSKISEVLIFSGIHDASVRNQIEDWLGAKYGIVTV